MAGPPAAGIAQMSVTGSDSGGADSAGLHTGKNGLGRVERNATHLPSGEKTGARASGSRGSAGAAFAGSPGTRHSDIRSVLSTGSIHWRTNTADLPSGDRAVSRGPSNRYRSSTARR